MDENAMGWNERREETRHCQTSWNPNRAVAEKTGARARAQSQTRTNARRDTGSPREPDLPHSTAVMSRAWTASRGHNADWRRDWQGPPERARRSGESEADAEGIVDGGHSKRRRDGDSCLERTHRRGTAVAGREETENDYRVPPS